MYNTIQEFIMEWNNEAASTQKVLDALTDASLQQQVSPEDRTLGRIAFHIARSTPGLLSASGLTVETLPPGAPSSAAEIADKFRKVSADTVDGVRAQWTDSMLKESVKVFGMELPRAVLLSMLIKHIVHHRGQITVLMRQAGLKVPGVYGPARDESVTFGM
ncbi:DinB family protein [Paenibacillus sp. UNC496MF]|uniref:DinB family protein n=1 Tax=Paenibacillus sp. UNC496MF TaxID=1502753 RepID=UPI000B84956F|nr:DinB family protein [Paenibacillus sp. UNC496MF]